MLYYLLRGMYGIGMACLIFGYRGVRSHQPDIHEIVPYPLASQHAAVRKAKKNRIDGTIKLIGKGNIRPIPR